MSEGCVTEPLQNFLATDHRTFTAVCSAYIYVIRAGEDGPVKIGVATNPTLRITELQCGSWMDLSFVAVAAVITGLARTAENAAHHVAAEHRIRGEWFDLEPLEAVSAILAGAAKAGVSVVSLKEYWHRQSILGKAELVSAKIERVRLLRVKLGMD